jgi:hypothetical protein
MGIDLAASRAVLIGVSAYEDPEFPGLRAARNSVDAMQEMLSDPRLCGWPPGRITVIRNPVSAAELALEVAMLAKSIDRDGALLVYYVGHGVLSDDGTLHLTVVSTRSDHPEITAVPWETVARELRRCRAGVRMAILDCCFSGQAIEALSADSGPGLADMAHVEGVYTLTATTRNRLAHVPPPDQQVTACTSFTEELRDLVYAGITGKPARLTIADLYPALYTRLRAKGLPLPNQRGTGTATLFPFTVNAAICPLPAGPAPAGEPAAPIAGSPGSAAPELIRRLLREARSIAQSISEEFLRDQVLTQVEQAAARDAPELAVGTATRSYLSVHGGQAATAASPDDAEVLARAITDKPQKSLALASVAVEVANADRDPDRVARLLSEAEHAALSTRFDRNRQSQALAGVAQVVAAVDAGRAERLAFSIRSKPQRATALAVIARRAASTSPDRAARLLSEAEHAALSTRFDRYRQSQALDSIARAFAAIDPHQAGRVALSIRDRAQRADCLAEIAHAILAADPDHAEHLVRAITKKPQRASALARIARDLPAADADRVERLLAEAERAAESIYSRYERTSVLARVAFTIASTAPERAERLALALSDPWQKAHILACIAQAMPPGDPRGARLVADMDRIARPAAGERWMPGNLAGALRDIAEAMVSTDPDLAIRFAQSITYKPWEAYTLACVAHGLTTVNPARADRLMSDAERTIRAVTDKYQQVTILVCIAEAWAQGTRPAQAPSPDTI